MLFLDHTPELTETDMIIYRAIAKNMNTVVYMRIRDLARETYCSTASIQRFCQKFECSGWAEFKTKLRLYLEQQTQRVQFATDLNSGEIIHSIMETDSQENQRSINNAAEHLAEKGQVIWFGCGTSRIIAEFGALMYSSLINMSLAITDPLNNPTVIFSSDTASDTCVIVCSVSGENRMVVKYVDKLVKNGVSIIAITNNPDSTIARMATFNLNYFATIQEVFGANITTQTPAVFLIEKLTRRVATILKQKRNLKNLQDNIR